jgi:hypothetical protein
MAKTNSKRLVANAFALLPWLAQRESAAVGEIVAAGLMSSREASDAIRYALRNGAVERVQVDTAVKASPRYRATGGALPGAARSAAPSVSFDSLLAMW